MIGLIKKFVNSDFSKPLNEGGVKVVKSVQRGVTSAAGNVTISAVNMAKTLVVSSSKGSTGYVASRGTFSGSTTGQLSGTVSYQAGKTSSASGYDPGNLTGNVSIGGTRTLTGSLSGGTTDLTTRQYSARLTAATTVYCDGPVEWQVVEYY